MNDLMIPLLSFVVRITLFALVGSALVLLAARFRSRVAMWAAAGTLVAAALLAPISFAPLPDAWSWHYASATPSVVDPVEQPEDDPIDRIATNEEEENAPEATTRGGFPFEFPEFHWPTVSADAAVPAVETRTPAEAFESYWVSWPAAILLAAAILFALLGIARLVVGWIGVTRMIRRSRSISDQGMLNELTRLRSEMNIAREVALLESAEITSPVTVGILRPSILLPPSWKDWSPEQQRAAIAHELAHIHSNDFGVALVGQAALAIHFYHPLLHWLYGQLRLQQEFAADAMAARFAGGTDTYLQSLANLALQSQPPRAFAAVRPFLPTVGVLMRRVTMLKSPIQPPGDARGSFLSKFTVALAIAVVALAAFGIRFSAAPATAIADDEPRLKNPLIQSLSGDEEETETPISPEFPRHDLQLLTDDGGMLIAIRPAELLAALKLKDKRLVDMLDEIAGEKIYPGMSAAEIDQLAIVLPPTPQMKGPEAALLRTRKPHDFTRVMTDWSNVSKKSQLEEHAHSGKTYYESPFAEEMLLGFYQADDRTLLVDAPSDIRRRIDGKERRTTLLTSEWDKVAASSHAAIAVSGEFFSRVMGPDLEREHTDPRETAAQQSLRTFATNVDRAYLSVNVKDNAELQAYIICHDEVSARATAGGVEALIRFGRASLREELAQLKERDDASRKVQEPAMKVVADLLADLSAEVRDDVVVVKGSAPVEEFLGAQLAAAISSSRQAAVRAESMNNLKQIGLAMHNYHDTHGHFPPPVLKGEKGQVYSWRVALLPYLEGSELYDRYQFDEPWDSTANKALIPLMPIAYRYPDDKTKKGNTPYAVLVGEKTIFPDDRAGVSFQQILDGTSNTILTVETQPTRPWTQPVDIAYDPEKPLPELGKFHEGGFLVGLGDGSVRFISKSIDKGVLRILVTRDDGKAMPDLGN